MTSGSRPASAAHARRDRSMADCRSGAATSASVALNLAAAWTYPARSAISAMMARSIRSISPRTSSSDPHSAGVFILYDYRMPHRFRYTILLWASVLAAAPQTLLENEQVRVLKAVDQPHAKGAPHEHK